MQRDEFSVEKFPSLDGFRSDCRDRAIRICIATEEILGPVRNGGIASTYYHLARGLARQGHKVTVMYLKGRKVENETPEHWIKHFAEFGIEFVFLDLTNTRLIASSQRWQRVYYSFYLWLKENQRFEIVHTSEWRGGAFYCLQAKRIGLAFRDIFFIVKTSSPHIWNRHYQMQPIDEPDMLAGSFAEQKCVEWADMVVGGSAHLLTFMKHIGYQLPGKRTYVQPNIIDFSEIKVEDRRPARDFGDLVHTKEVVFFGRLEPRKGLELFVDAVNALVAQGMLPTRVMFLGKEGERLGNRRGIKPLEFIAENASRWPFPVDVITDRNQPGALSYMCARDMIAVMPSLIENSSMAVYETLVHKIPFIATAVGGTPELVGEAYHDECLIAPDTESLARQLARALNQGQPIAAPAFDNEKNLETWYAFHRFIAQCGVQALNPEPLLDGLSNGQSDQNASISYIAYAREDADLDHLFRSLGKLGDQHFAEVWICVPFLLDKRRLGTSQGFPYAQIVPCTGLSAGESFNRVRQRCRGEILVFDSVSALEFSPHFSSYLRTALGSDPNSICTCIARILDDPLDPNSIEGDTSLYLPVGGDLASQYGNGLGFGVECIAMRSESFDRLGGFEPYNISAGTVHEYVSRAVLKGTNYHVVPEVGFDYVGIRPAVDLSTPNYEYIKTKAIIDAVPLPIKKILLLNLSRGNRGKPPRENIKFVGYKKGDDSFDWLCNGERIAFQGRTLASDPLPVGFDPETATLEMALLGWGYLRITSNQAEVYAEDNVGQPLQKTIRSLPVLPLLEQSDRAWIKISFNGDGRQRERTIAVQKLQNNLFMFVCRSRPYHWGKDLYSFIADSEGEETRKGTADLYAFPRSRNGPARRGGGGGPNERSNKTRERNIGSATEDDIQDLVNEARKLMMGLNLVS